MTNEEYKEYMNSPLSEEEKEIIRSHGWVFLNDIHIVVPDDYDGQMAFGIPSIRSILFSIKHKDLCIKHRKAGLYGSNLMKTVLDELES